MWHAKPAVVVNFGYNTYHCLLFAVFFKDDFKFWLLGAWELNFIYWYLWQLLNIAVKLAKIILDLPPLLWWRLQCPTQALLPLTAMAKVDHWSWPSFPLSTGAGRNYSSFTSQGSHGRAGTRRRNDFLFWLGDLCLCLQCRKTRRLRRLGPDKPRFESGLCLFPSCYAGLLIWVFSSSEKWDK